MKIRFSIFLLLILGLTSCDSGTVYEKYLDNDRITWNRFDVKNFEVEIKDVSVSYDFIIAIRHHTEVPLDYLDVQFIIETPSGEIRIMEPRIVLRDKEGKPTGEGMGDLWDVFYTVREGFEFTEAGTCKVEISSAMPKVDLPGIMQIGLIVRKSRKKVNQPY